MVDDVWKISEFYLKNRIFFFFYSILNFALMRTIGVNAKMVFLNMSLSLMEPINHCEKQQLTNISMLSRCNVCIFGFLS